MAVKIDNDKDALGILQYRNTVLASGKLTVRVRPFNGTRRAACASAGYRGQENFCYFRKLLTFVGVINFQLPPDNHLKRN